MSKLFTIINIFFSKFNLNNINLFSLSPIQNIISTQSILSTVSTRISEELLSDNLIIKELTKFQFHPQFDLFYTGLLVTTLFSKHKIYGQIDNKWNDIELATDTSKITKSILFIFILLFCKNIESAT